jgi:hypothetical protein
MSGGTGSSDVTSKKLRKNLAKDLGNKRNCFRPYDGKATNPRNDWSIYAR